MVGSRSSLGEDLGGALAVCYRRETKETLSMLMYLRWEKDSKVFSTREEDGSMWGKSLIVAALYIRDHGVPLLVITAEM